MVSYILQERVYSWSPLGYCALNIATKALCHRSEFCRMSIEYICHLSGERIFSTLSPIANNLLVPGIFAFKCCYVDKYYFEVTII